MRKITALFLFAVCAAAPAQPPVAVLKPAETYADRYQILNLLREKHPYPKGWTDHREGIRIQAQWQSESGREVVDADGQVFGWWPNVNWTLVVWPFLVLQQYRGEFPGVQVEQFTGWKKSRFEIPASFVASVLAYYDRLDQYRSLADGGYLPSWGKPWYEWELQRLMWDWHHKAVVTGMERNKDLLPGLVKNGDRGERLFAESWGTMVGLLKAVSFPTSAQVVHFFNYTILPQQWVRETDYQLSKPSQCTYPQRIALKALLSIHKFETRWGHPIEKLLRWFADSPENAKRAFELVYKALTQNWSGYGFWKAAWSL